VLVVAPDRLQIIAPYAGYRRKQRHSLGRYDSPESLSADALEAIQTMTVAATREQGAYELVSVWR
jgi:hypothetical protein